MSESNESTIKEGTTQDTYKKYNLLTNCLFWEIDKELSRKGRLDAKAAGYFSVLGVFFAAFLVIEPKLFEVFEIIDKCICLYLTNFILVIIYIIFLFIIFIFLKLAYKPKSREEPLILQTWEVLLKERYGNVCESIKKPLFKLYEEIFQDNEDIAKNLNTAQMFLLLQAVIITLLFCIYFSINSIIFWR